MSDFSFHKGERLSGKKAISALFLSGRGVTVPPFRFLYLPASGTSYPVRTAITVPKRLFRKAVDRNLLKRRIREAYRLLKPKIYREISKKGVAIHLVIQYQHGEIMPFNLLSEALQKGLEKLLSELNG
ncbi:MAG: ribonuclease P protein component [Bacteroidales bacterium]